MSNLHVLQTTLRSIRGQLVWGVSRGVGSYLTMEFGEPHLWIRQPVEPRNGVGRRVRTMLQRRRVFPHGEWHLWLYECHWIVQAAGKTCTNQSSLRHITRVAKSLSGERLENTSVAFNDGLATVQLEFDLGGKIEIDWNPNTLNDNEFAFSVTSYDHSSSSESSLYFARVSEGLE